MKQKDMNMIMAAVAVLVMLKTMVNRTFQHHEVENFEEKTAENIEESHDETPNQISDIEYEYLNELLENKDFENFKIEDFEHLDFKKLLMELNNNLEVKFSIMEHSAMLQEFLLKNINDFENGEAISDT